MQISRFYLVFLFAGFVFTSCIDRYSIDSGVAEDSRLVIYGILTNESKEQEITVSRSGSVEFPRFLPVSGCKIYVEDENHNKFILPESKDAGHYRAFVDPLFTKVGSCYRLFVETPNGRKYESNYEEMMPCPKVDSVYFELKTRPKSTVGESEEGIQFYVNFKGDESMGRFFRWSLQETYEYHSTWTIIRYLDEKSKEIAVPEDFSHYVCYQTAPIYEVFNLSTNGLTKNEYERYPLHFVNNETQRLLYHYSLLIKQYSMSEGSYNFWESLRKNNKDSNYLFGTQPASTRSNIKNVNDTTEIVLGDFGASAVSVKRIHIRYIPSLTFNKIKYCPNIKKNMRLDSIPTERPLYLYPFMRRNGTILWVWGDKNCFFCELLGGTTERPSYWDDK